MWFIKGTFRGSLDFSGGRIYLIGKYGQEFLAINYCATQIFVPQKKKNRKWRGRNEMR